MQRKSLWGVWKTQVNISDLVNVACVHLLHVYIKYAQIHKSCCKCMRFLSKMVSDVKNYGNVMSVFDLLHFSVGICFELD